MPPTTNGGDWRENKKYVLKAIEAINKDMDRHEKLIYALYGGAVVTVLGTVVSLLIKWGLGDGANP